MDLSLATLLSALCVAFLTSLSTLMGVFLTQRSSRKLQLQQAEAAATLDRERHKHQETMESSRRLHESAEQRWQRRCEVYSDYLRRVDQLISVGILPGTPDSLSAKFDAFLLSEYKVLLLAPAETATAALLLSDSAREAGAAYLDSSRKEPALKRVREAKKYFLQFARRDLESEGVLRLS